MTWQEYVRAEAQRLGASETSGYRTPAQERGLGGPASSYHEQGTPAAPGAIDFGGPAGTLKKLFDEIRQAFAGRINELYLNLPGGGSQDIKNNQPLKSNPEAGRPQHLHVAIGPPVLPFIPPNPLNAPNPLNPNDFVTPGSLDPAGSPLCKSICPPSVDRIWAHIRRKEAPKDDCWCWSDIWVYGAGVFLLVGGSWLMYAGAGRGK